MNLSNAVMATTLDQLPILAMLCKLVGAQSVIDLGTFTGISALQFALVCPSREICDAICECSAHQTRDTSSPLTRVMNI